MSSVLSSVEVKAMGSTGLKVNNGALNAKAIAAQAKAQLAAQKAQLEAQKKQLKNEESALKEESKALKTEAKYLKAEALAASGNSPYNYENIYKGTSEDWLENAKQQKALDSFLWIANWAKGSYGSMKALEKAQAQLEKAQAKIEKAQAKTPEFENGNEVIQTQLPQTHADVLNLIAEGLTATLGTGKAKGKVKINPAKLDKSTMLKKHLPALDSLIKTEYVESPSEGLYTFTVKGLAIFGLTWKEVEENFLAKQA